MSDEEANLVDLADPPEIPDQPDELIPAVSTLTNAAYMFRGVFVQAVEGKPLEEIFEERAV